MAMAANNGLTSVMFLKPWKGYNATDIAGFLPGQAQSLVRSGVAKFHKIEKPAMATVTKVPRLTPQPKKRKSRKPKKSKSVMPINMVDVTAPSPDPVVTDASEFNITMKD